MSHPAQHRRSRRNEPHTVAPHPPPTAGPHKESETRTCHGHINPYEKSALTGAAGLVTGAFLPLAGAPGRPRKAGGGYRFALFHHATQALGGAVRVTRFELSPP
ncbi:hypothetical protein ACF1BE_09660 [Streptomyces sp. NPDC014991]|uniref:hypothetical protein n=1 Tax=Streptomyces sp. NPDC014991 TaxID=3364935 RepID=UPI0036F79878